MFPNQRAAEIAVGTVKKGLDETGSDMKIVFNVFKDIDLEIYDTTLIHTTTELLPGYQVMRS